MFLDSILHHDPSSRLVNLEDITKHEYFKNVQWETLKAMIVEKPETKKFLRGRLSLSNPFFF